MRGVLFKIAIVACIAGEAVVAIPQVGVKTPPAYIVKGPTIIAFFSPVTEADLKKDPDINETLTDFQYYAEQVRGPLLRKGIQFHETYSLSFSTRIGSVTSSFHPDKIEVGYYFVAPGRKPRIEYGVMTDQDILAISKDYFTSTVRH